MGSANPGPSNYAANAGWPSYATGFHGERTYPGKYNGLITLANADPTVHVDWHPHRGIRAKDVTDGLSHTAAVAERLIQRGNSIAEIEASDRRVQSFHLSETPRTLDQMVTASLVNPHTDVIFSAYQGRAWISGWTVTGPTYMHVFTPNTLNMHFDGGETTGDNLVTPSSNHNDGVNVLMADGHVRFVLDDINLHTWWTMGSRNDGRIFDDPQN
jgi:prepilin-type processing-associated H-X9-DG protein